MADRPLISSSIGSNPNRRIKTKQRAAQQKVRRGEDTAEKGTHHISLLSRSCVACLYGSIASRRIGTIQNQPTDRRTDGPDTPTHHSKPHTPVSMYLTLNCVLFDYMCDSRSFCCFVLCFLSLPFSFLFFSFRSVLFDSFRRLQGRFAQTTKQKTKTKQRKEQIKTNK